MRPFCQSVQTYGEPGDARCTCVPCSTELPRYFEVTASKYIIPYTASSQCKVSTCGNTPRVTEYAPKAFGARSLRGSYSR
eukprot:1667783-Rhodomonas_salina.1